MKAVRIHAFGGPEVVVYEETPRPEPKANEVLFQVASSCLNYADVQWRLGNYVDRTLPATLGREAAGVIEAVGSGVTTFKPGQPIMARAVGGQCGICDCSRGSCLSLPRWGGHGSGGRYAGDFSHRLPFAAVAETLASGGYRTGAGRRIRGRDGVDPALQTMGVSQYRHRVDRYQVGAGPVSWEQMRRSTMPPTILKPR